MDAGRFDAISRVFADRTSRGQALRRLGDGGFLAALLGVAGVGRRRAAAQGDNDSSGRSCALDFGARVAVGPDAKTVFEGVLSLRLGSDGSIDRGRLDTKDKHTFEVVGHAVGRAIRLRIVVGDGQFLALTGTAEQPVITCQGRIDGTFGGPQRGDLGTWAATRQTRS